MTMMTGPKILHPPPSPVQESQKTTSGTQRSQPISFPKNPFLHSNFLFSSSEAMCAFFMSPSYLFCQADGPDFLVSCRFCLEKNIFFILRSFWETRENFPFFPRRGSKHVSEFSFLLLFLWGAKVMCRALRNANAEDTERGF